MSKERNLIEVIFLPIIELKKFQKALTKFAEDGYVIENAVHINAKDGGVVCYTLRDALASEEIEDTDTEEPEAGLAADDSIGHSEGNGAALPEPEIVEGQ